MADSNSVKDIFDLINKDTSKILGLSFNGKTIALGAYVARAGTFASFLLFTILLF